jgi:hypothetical protein
MMNHVAIIALAMALGGGSVAAYQHYAPTPPAAVQTDLAPQLAQLHADLTAQIQQFSATIAQQTQQVLAALAQQTAALKQIADDERMMAQATSRFEAERTQARNSALAAEAKFREQWHNVTRN